MPSCLVVSVLLVVLTTHQATYALVRGGAGCPGLSGGVCSKDCRLHVCNALSTFYNTTNDIDPSNGPWVYDYGWHSMVDTPCGQLMEGVANGTGLPLYCSWFGITCCDAAGVSAGLCSAAGAVMHLNMPNNLINASIAWPGFVEPLHQLHDCGLTVINLELNSFTGSLVDEWGEMANLQVLNLGNSWITGPIPESLQNLRNLTEINLSNAYISGSLSPWFGNLSQLRQINLALNYLTGPFPQWVGSLTNLEGINLAANSLTGTLPETLCHDPDNRLLQINLFNNALEGPAQVLENCRQLLLLDISYNRFTGPLPASPFWTHMTVYNAKSNGFSGIIPSEFCLNARMLKVLDISYNQLSGSIPTEVGLMSNMQILVLEHNMLTGPVAENLFFFPGIGTLDLSDNLLQGTLPAYAMGFPWTLRQADFSNNSGIHGLIPPELAFIAQLAAIDFSNTGLSCEGWSQAGHIHQQCAQDQALPCFLEFSAEPLPRDDKSNMKCKSVVRKQPEAARAACAMARAGYTLVGQAAELPDISPAPDQQRWIIDPSYYQYQGCSCLQGYQEVWSNDHTSLKCIAQHVFSMDAAVVAVLAASGSILLCAMVLVLMVYIRTQPRWLRERGMQAKRMKGKPRCTRPGARVGLSVVVTDVKDYTALTREHPKAMSKAMGRHNNILRKACHIHAGYVLSQEGDSWTVVFHDAEDAVAFSLQVQQALASKAWALEMAGGTSLKQAAQLTQSSDAGPFQAVMQAWRSMAGEQLAQNSKVAGPDDADALISSCGSTLGPDGILRLGKSEAGEDKTYMTEEAAQLAAAQGQAQPERADSLMDIANLIRAIGSKSAKLAPSKWLSNPRSSADGELETPSSLGGRLTPTVNSRKGWPWLLSREPSKSNFASHASSALQLNVDTHQLECSPGKCDGCTEPTSPLSKQPEKTLRLHIRIGISSGALPFGLDVVDCSVTKRARELVSDVANGDQVLLDEPTFMLVKDSISTLGTVNENGYDDASFRHLMNAKALQRVKQWLHCSRATSQDLSDNAQQPDDEAQDYEHDAIVLHMGCFATEAALRINNEEQLMQQQATSRAGSQPQSRAGSRSFSSFGGAVLANPSSTGDALVELLTAGLPGKSSAASLQQLQAQIVSLYSIAGPGMRCCEHLHRNHDGVPSFSWAQPVNMKPDWKQLQKGYCEAPGAHEMAMISANIHISNDQLQPAAVTIVFISIADGSNFTMKHTNATIHTVNKTILKVMLQQMEAIPDKDGYLCRSHEADLKYMCAFSKAHHAVQWCLLVQEALLYEDWQPQVLKHPGFGEMLDPTSGLPVFRGPRLRMGLAQGQPDRMLPDHSGRANYFGQHVNLAARFMDAASHGGQVVTNLQLAQSLMEEWGTQDWGEQLNSVLALSPDSQQANGWASSPGKGRAVRWIDERPSTAAAKPAVQQIEELDAVNVLHLGRFRFKGDGEYAMVQFLHGAICRRIFPQEPPHGKGERVAIDDDGVIEGLPQVWLPVPASLQAGRKSHVQRQAQTLLHRHMKTFL